MRARPVATFFACLTPLVAAAQAATPASAQTGASAAAANRRGFFVGFDPLAYATLQSDELTAGKIDGGTGVSLRFGWGFNEVWAIVMDVPVTDLTVSDTADYLLSHGDIALVYSPVALKLLNRQLLPFVQIGGGFRSLEATRYLGGEALIYSFEGEVLSLGAGARLYVEPAWAIALQGWWSLGEFNDERVGNTTTHNRNVSATSTRVQLGLEWHLGRKAR